MKAIVQDNYGSADVLELREVEKPHPGDDELLIRVHAAGVDPGTDGTRRFDLILDTAGRRPLSRLRRALTPRTPATGKVSVWCQSDFFQSSSSLHLLETPAF
jgi:hypothetical protein